MGDLPALSWHKSSYSSGNNGACVELAVTPDGEWLLRDSKDRTLPPHRFTPVAWRAFLHAVKTGRVG